jgi:purine-binding chemotaxis protein CheW
VESDVLIFEIEGRRFGVRADLVSEVLRAVTPVPLPSSATAVMGMINLRGRPLPVLKTRQRLGLAPRGVRHTDHLLVIDDGQLSYALHVDRAIDLVRLKIAAPSTTAEAQVAHTPVSENSIGLVAAESGGLTHVIEPADLLSDQDRTDIRAIVSSPTVTEIPM